MAEASILYIIHEKVDEREGIYLFPFLPVLLFFSSIVFLYIVCSIAYSCKSICLKTTKKLKKRFLGMLWVSLVIVAYAICMAIISVVYLKRIDQGNTLLLGVIILAGIAINGLVALLAIKFRTSIE